MATRTHCGATCLAAVVFWTSGAAWAQAPATPTPPGKPVEVSADAAAAAEALFQEARTLSGQKRFAEACPKFAESQRLDPGVGTLMNLGDCYEQEGKLASAWVTYREAMNAAKRTNQPQREIDAKHLADRIEPKLRRLVVRVPEASQRPSLVVKRNGQIVDSAQWGMLIPTDYASNHITAEAPGYAPWSSDVEIPEAGKSEIQIPALEALPETPGEDLGKGQRTAGFIGGAVGVITLGVGGALGLVAMNQKKSARDLGCTDVDCATPEAKDKNDTALRSANIATVLFIAGGVLTAAGAVLVLSAPGRAPSTPGTAPAATRQRWIAATLRGTMLGLEGGF